MKFAFSVTGPDVRIDTLADLAHQFGFNGLEFHFPAAVPEELKIRGVAMACLAGGDGYSGGYCGQRTEDHASAAHIRSLIDLAGRLDCAIVKVGERGQIRNNRSISATALGDWLMPLADYAADRNVTLALENSRSLRTAREIWAILDRCNHPSLGCCLDVLTSVILGESPQVTVPMLNSRIVYVQLADVKDLANPLLECGLGEGVVPIKTTIARLRGIGYSGWAAVRLSQGTDDVEARLSKAIQSLRDWTEPVERAKTKVKAAR